MHKRYQVFVSSTFIDLEEERWEVISAILEDDNIPAGMELFPAANSTAWEMITKVISESDYFILIIGGRYGSTDDSGLGFTEKEYDFAVDHGVPVIPLLRKDVESLPRDKTEIGPLWKKLLAFRKKVEATRTCKYWSTAEELGAQASRSLVRATKQIARTGWVRADEMSSNALMENLQLQKRIAALEIALAAARTAPPSDAGQLASGEDTVQLSYYIKYTRPDGEECRTRREVSITWDFLFQNISPSLMGSASESELKKAIDHVVSTEGISEALAEYSWLKPEDVNEVKADSRSIDKCIVQFRALQLIESYMDTKLRGTLWRLTPYGDQVMTRLLAEKRPPASQQSENTPIS